MRMAVIVNVTIEAGGRLAARIVELEKGNRPYCLVGHSQRQLGHRPCARRASKGGRPLESLRRWITVGTPFIETKRLPLLLL